MAVNKPHISVVAQEYRLDLEKMKPLSHKCEKTNT